MLYEVITHCGNLQALRGRVGTADGGPEGQDVQSRLLALEDTALQAGVDGLDRRALAEQPRVQCRGPRQQGVITSYSIHYTKVYDALVVSVDTQCPLGHFPHSNNHSAGVNFHGVDNCLPVNGQ